MENHVSFNTNLMKKAMYIFSFWNEEDDMVDSKIEMS